MPGQGQKYIASIDQGTSSSRCIIFDKTGATKGKCQAEHRQIYPKSGSVEHDALEIWDKVQNCIKGALSSSGLKASDLAAVGITNQRESTLVWDRHTGKPLHNVLVWTDTRNTGVCDRLKRNGGQDKYREVTGLPIATYFAGTKLKWLLENVPGLQEAAEKGDAIFGTLDTWLVWKLTEGALHMTDVTNASRTMLMNLRTQQWDDSMIREFGIPRQMLPEIRSCSEVYGHAKGLLEGVPIAGILGDQQAALFGQCCTDPGLGKCTYGTGCFVLLNTGDQPAPTSHGLLQTVAYKLGDQPCKYALEGSIAYGGSTVQWLRDNLEMVDGAENIEKLASSVPDNGDVYFVPAFAGLYAPYWRDDARGVLCGLTAFNTKAHFARAVLEATAFQVHEVLEAMKQDADMDLRALKVDGGMTANNLLMQFQADLLDTQVLLPKIAETTALGAAFVAGLAVGVWGGVDELKSTWALEREWGPKITADHRGQLCKKWKTAIEKSMGWMQSGGEGATEAGNGNGNGNGTGKGTDNGNGKQNGSGNGTTAKATNTMVAPPAAAKAAATNWLTVAVFAAVSFAGGLAYARRM